MSYHIKTKPRKNIPFSHALKIITIFLVLVFLIGKLFPSIFFKALEPIAKPIWDIRNSIGDSLLKKFSFITSKTTLIDENNKLKESLLSANIELENLDSVLRENEILKREFASTSSKFIPARVVTRPNQSAYDMFIVDMGENKTSVGKRVYGLGGVLLGEISEVFGHTAKVRLYSNPGLQTQVEIAKSNTPLLLTGRGSGNFSVVVPKDVSIAHGDLVIAPSFDSQIIARVGSIEETEADSFKTVLLSYPLNIFELNWVQISNEFR